MTSRASLGWAAKYAGQVLTLPSTVAGKSARSSSQRSPVWIGPRNGSHRRWLSSITPVSQSGSAPFRKRRAGLHPSPTSSTSTATCSHRATPVPTTSARWPPPRAVATHDSAAPSILWERKIIPVVVQAEVGDEFLTGDRTQRVLQLGGLDEEIVFDGQTLEGHRALEIEAQPLLDAAPFEPASQVEEERDVQHQRRREDGIPAEEVDLDLHRVAEPAGDVDVVPTLLRIAARWVVV